MSPAVSKKQQRFFGAELARKREGKKTQTKMSEKQLREYAGTPRKGLPEKKKPPDHAEENAKERMKMMGGGMMMPKKEMEKKMAKKAKRR